MNNFVNITHDASLNLTTSVFDEARIFEMFVLCFNFMLGLPTHSYVIWLIIMGSGSGVQSDFFILSLSVCGLFYSGKSLLYFLTKWYLFDSLLAVCQFLLGVVITGSPLFQCLMCVERYLAVVHPVTFLKYKPLRYRVICCIVAWIIILGSCFISMFSFLLFTVFTYMWFLSLQFLFFLSIQLFCCVAVLRALKQSGPGKRGREREEENHMKRKAFYLIQVITVNTVITYVPFTATGLLIAVTKHNFQILMSFSFICFTLTNLVTPILFLHRIGKLSCHRVCNIMN